MAPPSRQTASLLWPFDPNLRKKKKLKAQKWMDIFLSLINITFTNLRNFLSYSLCSLQKSEVFTMVTVWPRHHSTLFIIFEGFELKRLLQDLWINNSNAVIQKKREWPQFKSTKKFHEPRKFSLKLDHNSLTVNYLLLSPDETVFPKWKKKEVSTFCRNAIKKTG